MIGDTNDISKFTREIHNLPGEYPLSGPEAVFRYLNLKGKKTEQGLGTIIVHTKDVGKFSISLCHR